jgi:hypothetical protein
VTDWREEARREHAERVAAERLAKEKRRADEAVALEAEHRQRLAALRCHECGKQAAVPATHDEKRFFDINSSTIHRVTDWSKPGDLETCYRCKQFTCEEHYIDVRNQGSSHIRPLCRHCWEETRQAPMPGII